MKRLKLLIIGLLMFTVMVGCETNAIKEEGTIVENQMLAEEEKDLSIGDYFPFRENLSMDYAGFGNEYAEQSSRVEFIEDNRIQLKIINPGTTLVKILEYSNGELVEVFSEGEFYHIENMINANSNSHNIILKEPIELGNKWTNSQGYEMEITDLAKEIDLPAGRFQALEVTSNYGEGRFQREYYAKDLGLIARIYEDESMEVKTLLEDYDFGKMEADIKVFYPSKVDMTRQYRLKQVKYETNEDMKKLLEGLLKDPEDDSLLAPLTANAKIKNLSLNRDSWTLEVDFSKELVSEMKAGSGLEVEILASIVNTLGKFYDVEKVYITVEGQAYESGHISLRSDEYFTVDIVEIEE